MSYFRGSDYFVKKEDKNKHNDKDKDIENDSNKSLDKNVERQLNERFSNDEIISNMIQIQLTKTNCTIFLETLFKKGYAILY